MQETVVTPGDSPVFEVSSEGEVHALALGEAEVVATNNGFSTSRRILVVPGKNLFATVNGGGADPDEGGRNVGADAVSDGGGGGFCFIATAAFGSYLDPQVEVLRNFRDNILLTSTLGKSFVNFYYEVSPPMADYIRERETLKTATRWALTPLVYGIAYPKMSILIFFSIVIAIIFGFRIRKTAL